MLRLDYIDFIPSPNKSERKNNQKPTWIVIHSMQGFYGSRKNGTIERFLRPSSRVSAHYLVSKKGDMVCMVNPQFKAWHVGSFNSCSIGIELEDMDMKTKKHCMSDPKWITDVQLDRAAALVAALMRKYLIPMTNVIGHNDKMLVEKYGSTHSDPGPYFPWEKFRELVKKHLEPNKNEQTK